MVVEELIAELDSANVQVAERAETYFRRQASDGEKAAVARRFAQLGERGKGLVLMIVDPACEPVITSLRLQHLKQGNSYELREAALAGIERYFELEFARPLLDVAVSEPYTDDDDYFIMSAVGAIVYMATRYKEVASIVADYARGNPTAIERLRAWRDAQVSALREADEEIYFGERSVRRRQQEMVELLLHQLGAGQR